MTVKEFYKMALYDSIIVVESDPFDPDTEDYWKHPVLLDELKESNNWKKNQYDLYLCGDLVVKGFAIYNWDEISNAVLIVFV